MHAAALRAFGDGFRRLPLGRPDEAARRIVRALRRGRSTLVYPGRLRVVRSFPTVSRWLSDRLVIPRLLGEMARMPRWRWDRGKVVCAALQNSVAAL